MSQNLPNSHRLIHKLYVDLPIITIILSTRKTTWLSTNNAIRCNHRWLRSSSSLSLLIWRTRLITVCNRAFSVAGKLSLEQSATHRHISSNSRCFLESTQNLQYLFSRSFMHWLMLTHCLVVYQFSLRPLSK